MPKHSCHHAWLHDNRNKSSKLHRRVRCNQNVCTRASAIMSANKHRQRVEKLLCHCGCGDGVSLLLYTIRMLWGWSHTFANCTHISVLPLCCGWAFVLMHNIRACFWVYSALHKVWDWSLTAYDFTHAVWLTLQCGWALADVQHQSMLWVYFVLHKVWDWSVTHATATHTVVCDAT